LTYFAERNNNTFKSFQKRSLENLLEPPPLNDDLQNFTAGGVGARSGGRQFDCRSGGCCCV